jgi:hypothetical protein
MKYADEAIRHVRAVLDVGIERARLELARRAASVKIKTRGFRNPGDREGEPLAPDLWRKVGSWSSSYGDGLPGYAWVAFDNDDMLACFPLDTTRATKMSRKRAGGAKPKFDWDSGVIAEVMRRVDLDGRPSNVREFTREILDWCANEFSEEDIPAEQTLRARITKWISRLPPRD